MDCAPMKKNVIALAASPASTCGVSRNDRGSRAMPCLASTPRSTRTSTASTAMPHATAGSAGEMPNTVNGAPGNGAIRPQDEIPDRPISTRNRPTAASATPAPSKRSPPPVCSMRGRSQESAATAAK